MKPVIFAFLLLASSLWLPAAHHQAGVDGKKVKKQDAVQAEELFAQRKVLQIKIELTATNLSTLEKEPKSYVTATLTEGDTVYTEVALHLKGGTGSFRPMIDRPALTLNFDKFNEGQRFHGLDKIHLNNSVQDPTWMTETICGEMFRSAGVPAARTSYARVELNGRDLGLYLLQEGMEKTFLRCYFSNPGGNLYDSGAHQDITQHLERTSGTGPADQTDLKALAAAANEPDLAKRLARLQPLLDLDRFISFVAVEDLTWHADGYSMRKNNYRLYHDPTTGLMVFIPHGMDQMFGDPSGPLMADWNGLVARAVLQTPEGQRRYRERAAKLLDTVFKADALDARITKLAELLRPTVAGPSDPAALKRFDDAVAQLRERVSQRARFLERELKKPGK